jgi:hypothetical protein
MWNHNKKGGGAREEKRAHKRVDKKQLSSPEGIDKNVKYFSKFCFLSNTRS